MIIAGRAVPSGGQSLGSVGVAAGTVGAGVVFSTLVGV